MALDFRSKAWSEEQRSVSYSETSAMLTEWKQQDNLLFLVEVSCVPLQQTLRHLQAGFGRFFKGLSQHPNFKRKSQGGSAEFTRSAFRWQDGRLWLAKCPEPLNIRWSRPLPKGSRPSTVTIRLSPTNKWSVSILVDDPTIKPLPKAEGMVGVDLGLTSLLVTSAGEKIPHPWHFQKLKQQLAKAQQALARKVKGSNNRRKARTRVARVYEHIRNLRRDFLHKLTTRLVRENQTIAVEDLDVKGLLEDSDWAQSIADASWGELLRQLTYKAEWYGRRLIKVDRYFPSSQLCSGCGHRAGKLSLSVRSWQCPACGVGHDRDVNAARNILAAGLAERLNACIKAGTTLSQHSPVTPVC